MELISAYGFAVNSGFIRFVGADPFTMTFEPNILPPIDPRDILPTGSERAGKGS